MYSAPAGERQQLASCDCVLCVCAAVLCVLFVCLSLQLTGRRTMAGRLPCILPPSTATPNASNISWPRYPTPPPFSLLPCQPYPYPWMKSCPDASSSGSGPGSKRLGGTNGVRRGEEEGQERDRRLPATLDGTTHIHMQRKKEREKAHGIVAGPESAGSD